MDEFLLKNNFYYFLFHAISIYVPDLEMIFIYLFLLLPSPINNLEYHWPDLSPKTCNMFAKQILAYIYFNLALHVKIRIDILYLVNHHYPLST